MNAQLIPETKRLSLAEGQKVILLVGPAGGGKGTISSKIAEHDNWTEISEDGVWDELNHPPDQPRTPEKFLHVKQRSVEHIEAVLKTGKSVVFEFLVYDNPPIAITDYQGLLSSKGIPFETKVLRPSAERILENQWERGRPREQVDLERQRMNAEHQLSCLGAAMIKDEWVVDSTNLTVDEAYQHFFAELVESD